MPDLERVIPSRDTGWVTPHLSRSSDTATPHPDSLVPRRLQVSAAVGWRVLVVAACGWLLLHILAITSHVIVPIGVALLLTALLAPLTSFLVLRLHCPRYLAAALTVVGALGLIVGLTALAGNSVINGWSDLGAQFGGGLDQIQHWLAEGPLGISGDQLSTYLANARQWAKDHGDQLTTGALQVGSVATMVATGALLALVSTLFFLADGQQIWRWFAFLMPVEYRQQVHESLRRGWLALGSYIRTQIVVAGVDALGIAVGAWILGLPFFLPTLVIVFFASLIPIVGAVASGGLVVVLALFVKGPIGALIMLAIVLAVQQIEGHVLQPLLMGKAMNLHPWAVIIGVALGSFLMGIVGALFAVPLMAMTNTCVRYLTGHDPFPSLGNSPLQPPPNGPEQPGPPAVSQPWWKRLLRRGTSTAEVNSAEPTTETIATDPR